MIDAYSPPQSNVADHNIKVGAITEEMVNALRGTKGWVQLIGILMFIGAAFMVIGALGMIFGGAMMASGAPGMPQGMFTGVGVVYLVMSVVYIFPATYLVKYGSAIGRLVSDGRAEDMEAALQQQQKFWKFVGVLALVMIVLMVIGMVAAVALPMMMMRGHT